MRSNLKLMMIFMLLASLFTACVKEEFIYENLGEANQGFTVTVMTASTRTAEDYASTTFTPGDKIGLFVVIGGYIKEFNICYTMNAYGDWNGDGSYWGDENSDVYYFAYYPYREDYFFYENYAAKTLGLNPSDEFLESLASQMVADTEDWRDYQVDPTYNGDASDKDLFFFDNLIDQWDIKYDQSGTGYTNSDLMVCQGYFNQSTVNSYPLVLKLAHQHSMIHLEFPDELNFQDASGKVQTEFSDNPQANDAVLSVWIDAIEDDDHTELIAGVYNIEGGLKDLSEDSLSIYYNTPNNFRYILRPHTSVAYLHIKYSYYDDSNVLIDKTFNQNLYPVKNSYTHYLMDDGQIPTGDPQPIRTAGDFPTCVGAFWRYNESGERVVKIQPIEEDYGAWRALVYKMDANWDNTSDIRLSTETANIKYYNTNAENYQITTLAQTVSGIASANEPIVFRIGLTDEDFDMKGLTGAYVPARYAVIMLMYADSKKYQLIYLRQGEDPDYLFEQDNDAYIGASSAYTGRFHASKISPYNLTSSTWASTYDTQEKVLYGQGVFVDYPSKLGGYTAFANTADPCWMYSAYSADNNFGNSSYQGPNDVWSNIYTTYEQCPANYPSADSTYFFNYERPHSGSESAYISSYVGTASQVGQSLFAAPLANDPTNVIAGYYADGYYDRYVLAGTWDPSYDYGYTNYAATGLLFYNSRDFASVFFPTGGVKSTATPAFAVEELASSSNQTFPIIPKNGYYLTATQYATNLHYYLHLMADYNTSGVDDAIVAGSAGGVSYAEVTHSGYYAAYGQMLLRPFVETEAEAAAGE